ncbi:HD domain-containing protein [Aspergillus candidus]|uniref:5'-deoxynucleotidase n=1 Tax=Aspergillus candidus TaxID=41067 RepID=A0A2I2F0N3_ASPCN|nr:putative hydrolases of HD superfamily [Aspergillus candidus]PLB34167.1 putative hydrolases of HD superfamily [Aspergillus candidus]
MSSNSTTDNPSWTVDSALSTLPQPLEENSTSPIPFFHLLGLLKTTKREGWRRFGINSGESVSDHMYRMSMMTMLAPPSLAARLNLPHCMKMALVHDMAESLVGDITPADGVDKPEKARREADTMNYISNTLLGGVPGGMLTGPEILKVFQEYEDNETLEAQFVHDVDKMELLLQMVEYEHAHAIDLTEFCHVAARITLPETKEWAAAVMQEREAFWKKQRASTETNGVTHS